MNLILYILKYRQNEAVNYIDYIHHYLPDEHCQEEATDYDVPTKKYKSIRFNKETHPLSLMVYSYSCICTIPFH